MRISDWSSDVCSSDLLAVADREEQRIAVGEIAIDDAGCIASMARDPAQRQRLGRPRQQQLATCIDERLSHMVLGLRAACPPPWRDVCCVDPETSGQSVLSCPLPRRERTKVGRRATRFGLSEHCYLNRIKAIK